MATRATAATPGAHQLRGSLTAIQPNLGGSGRHVRKKGVIVRKQIVIGTYAKNVGDETKSRGSSAPPTPEGHDVNPQDWHEWTVLLRGKDPSEDISTYIDRVEFNLHNSFQQPRRVIKKAPFEVSERGWGEFKIEIRIFFQDPNERPVDMVHDLRFKVDEPGRITHAHIPETLLYPSADGMVISERCDELIFTEPTEEMFQLLATTRPPLKPHRLQDHFNMRFDDTSDYAKMLEAAAFVQQRIAVLKQELRR